MNKILKMCFQLFSFLFVFVFFIDQTWAVTIHFNQSSSSILVGDSIDIDIVIAGLDPENLAEFDFNINYDSTVLSFDGYVLGSGLGDIAIGEAVDWSLGDNGAGRINLAELSWIEATDDMVYGDTFFEDQTTSLILATLSFTGSAEGNTNVSLSNVILGDELANSVTASFGTASIMVSEPVPEPTTILLFGVGLLGLAGFGKKKQFKLGGEK